MIVVADTSVVLNLSCLRQEHLLQELFEEVLIPQAVVREFERLANSDPRFRGLAVPTFLRIVKPELRIPELTGDQRLHHGEIEAITLAVEHNADLLLMDERVGRSAAASLQLRCVGILGVLIQSKRMGFLDSVGPVLDSLERHAGFWLSEALKNRILEIAGE